MNYSILAIRIKAGTKNTMKLAERKVVSFFTSVSGIDTREVQIISIKNIDDHGKSSGVVLDASTCFCLTINLKKAYGILRDGASHSKVIKFSDKKKEKN